MTDTLIKFKKGLLGFLDEMIEQFPDESKLVIARVFLADQIAIETVMDEFLDRLTADDWKLKKEVADRNEQFFLEEFTLMNIKADEEEKYMKSLWNSGKLDEDDKDAVWAWADHFIRLGVAYNEKKTK